MTILHKRMLGLKGMWKVKRKAARFTGGLTFGYDTLIEVSRGVVSQPMLGNY